QRSRAAARSAHNRRFGLSRLSRPQPSARVIQTPARRMGASEGAVDARPLGEQPGLMADASAALIELRVVSKDYRSLRPLRIHDLQVRHGESVALIGLDAIAAEVLVSMITGATLPDAGEARVLGKPTSTIASGEEWLTWLEQFGLFSNRTVLVDQLNVEQNLALALTLEVEDM